MQPKVREAKRTSLIDQHKTDVVCPAFERPLDGPRFLGIAWQGLLVMMSLCLQVAIGGCSKEADQSANSSSQGNRHIVRESFTNTLGMRFRYIPPGEFMMGTSVDSTVEGVPEVYLKMEVPHTVQIKQGFWIQTTEVTNEQFLEFVAASGYDGGEQGNEDFLRHLHDPKYAQFRGANKPVVFVSMYDAIAFAQWLSRKESRSYRLPTEQEWEYACKSGGTPNGSETASNEKLTERAWYKANSQQCSHEVAQKKANRWGVHDMLGNVWEWTSSPFPEDIAEESGLGKDVRHIRGGSFDNSASACRCAARWAGWPPTKRSRAVGFRLVCDGAASVKSEK